MFTFILCGVAVFSAISFGHASVVRPFDQQLDQNILSLQVDPDEGTCVSDCDSQIFCQGEFLHDVQMNLNLDKYNDSKTFVDMKLLHSEDEIIAEYRMLREKGILKLEEFVRKNFIMHKLNEWTPSDFPSNKSIEQLPLIRNIKDTIYKKFAFDLVYIWKNLSERVDEDVKINNSLYSAIYLPNGFIKAGGRFREMYYWDSYWIIRGLILSNMKETARGMIENMFELIKKVGHIPNGARKYYLQRSQPPLLMKMADEYYKATQNETFIRDNLIWLETEFQFWYTKRMVTVSKNGREYLMARHNAPSCSPRPESYRKDFTDSQELSKSERAAFYTALKSAAETGWDFSSRYIRGLDGLSPGYNLTDLDTTSFILVDLNSLLHFNAKFLGRWFEKIGATHKSKTYNEIADKLLEAINKVLWNKHAGVWLDWDIKTMESRKYFYPSNLSPLWTNSYDVDNEANKKKIVESVLGHLRKYGIATKDNLLSPQYFGVPTSLQKNISQQWDLPNGWAPLQAMVIQGLNNAGTVESKKLAFDIAQKWVRTNYECFTDNNQMHEKYDVEHWGNPGGSGEYIPQTGFGWSNGLILELFETYGQQFTWKNLSLAH